MPSAEISASVSPPRAPAFSKYSRINCCFSTSGFSSSAFKPSASVPGCGRAGSHDVEAGDALDGGATVHPLHSLRQINNSLVAIFVSKKISPGFKALR